MKHPYTTRTKHGKYPVGTHCTAERLSLGVAKLTFEDGGVVLLGAEWYLPGIDPPQEIVSVIGTRPRGRS